MQTQIQQIRVNLHYWTPAEVRASGPKKDWKIVQEKWLERLDEPARNLKEPNAEVYLAEPME